jgi:hypothetical protein
MRSSAARISLEGGDELMATLTTRGRKRMTASKFALPGKRYPIHDMAHARNALARGSANASPHEYAIIKRKVYHRYPSLNPKKK